MYVAKLGPGFFPVLFPVIWWAYVEGVLLTTLVPRLPLLSILLVCTLDKHVVLNGRNMHGATYLRPHK